ncbi:Transposable element Tcb2 transposase [Anabarilius grahami]|uniref:Transposable element Tcb2 transposase n=1 Tax=Anabarilius grahami TaxID=495550 RepID=A0A3N0Y4L8_ANAGA|nr:Transposable element Tcb2 transposase [Anabarilius grahami]
MPQMSQVLRERAIGMLTAGMSTRAVARELNVHFSTIRCLQRRFREFGSTSNRPHNHRPLCRRNRLEWANAHIRWHLALWRGVLFTDESQFSLYRADGRQRVWRHVGDRFADVNVVDRVAHGGGGVMVWAGLMLRPIVVPFIHDHHLMLQHENARPHVARICTQFLEAENIPVLAWPAYSPDMSPIEHVWDALDWRIRQRVPVPANIHQLRTAFED